MDHSHAMSMQEEGTGILKECRRVVLLVGTPNSGKSTLFNYLSGGNVRVGNWPGVTAEIYYHKRGDQCIVDLPGVYGLGGGSVEEEMLISTLANIGNVTVLFILDGTQPEAGIYLLVQLLEAYKGPVKVIVTKSILSHGLGIHIDVEGLERRLGLPVIRVSVLEGIGVDKLAKALETEEGRARVRINYGSLDGYIEMLEHKLSGTVKIPNLSPRWIAAQLLSGDPIIRALVSRSRSDIVEEADRIAAMLAEQGVDPEEVIASQRLNYAEDLVRRHVIRRRPGELYTRLEKVLLHPILGPLAGGLVLFTSFLMVFTLSTGFPLNMILYMAGFEGAARALEEYSIVGLIGGLFSIAVERIPESPGLLDEVLASVLSGVGIVASFIPLIAIATAFMALLEDSGIMTRIAVAFHPFMQRMGVSGRSVYPYLLGLGCNVPAVMATRLLPERERVRVIVSLPLVICSARLIVLITFVFAFFHNPLVQASVAVSVYILSSILALFTARIAGLLSGRSIGEKVYLVMDLPLMHKPSMKVVWWSVRSSLIHFIKKMGGPITVAAIIIWLLLSVSSPSGYSLGEHIGGAVGIIFKPIGISGDASWILGLSMLTGSLVKEVIIETIGVAKMMPDPQEAVSSLALTPAQAYSVLLFYMFYTPCIATAMAIYFETRNRRLLASTILYTFSIATIIMYLSYTILSLAGV
ncbi:MAG: ferrous iron transport protein B [Desulfurococcales archaeon]|nr:ferrous iron transport protein B [Desulfurococcales archaeon]